MRECPSCGAVVQGSHCTDCGSPMPVDQGHPVKTYQPTDRPGNAPPVYGLPPYGQPYPPPYSQPYGSQPRDETLGIIALVLGILSFIFIFVLSLIGMGLAIAAIVIGWMAYRADSTLGLIGVSMGLITFIILIALLLLTRAMQLPW